jgi:hypothetical protein
MTPVRRTTKVMNITFVYQGYKDVRLVGTPPREILGKFEVLAFN